MNVILESLSFSSFCIQAQGIHLTRSITSMINVSRPLDEEIKHLAIMAKFLENLFQVSAIPCFRLTEGDKSA